MSENPYFEAMKVRTQHEADTTFEKLLREAISQEPYTDTDALRERVVSSLMWVSGYYDDETSKRTARFFAHKSPYRR